MSNRVDRLVWQFRASAPEFYDKYQVARAPVNPPTSNTEPAPVPLPTDQPVAKAA